MQQQLAETQLGINVQTPNHNLHQNADNFAETQAGETREDKYLVSPQSRCPMRTRFSSTARTQLLWHKGHSKQMAARPAG